MPYRLTVSWLHGPDCTLTTPQIRPFTSLVIIDQHNKNCSILRPPGSIPSDVKKNYSASGQKKVKYLYSKPFYHHIESLF